MKFTRRDFLKLGGFASVATVGFSGSVFARTKDNILADQTAESFRQMIGTEFYIQNENTYTTATLIKVEDFPNQTKKGECFALIFKTSLKQTEQGTYNIYHSKIGSFELMMTAGRSGKNGSLIATINRI